MNQGCTKNAQPNKQPRKEVVPKFNANLNYKYISCHRIICNIQLKLTIIFLESLQLQYERLEKE